MCLLMVIFIHAKFILSRWSEYVDTSYSLGEMSWFVQFLISENIARIAVPLFFFISGFFLSIKLDGSVAKYWSEIRKRVKSVLLPYVLFCMLWALPYAVMGKSLDWKSLLVFPIPYQFWFLQHLMILVVLSYVIYKVRKYDFIILVSLLTLYVFSPQRWGGFEESLLFFSLGIYNDRIKYVMLPKRWNVRLLVLFFAIIILNYIVGMTRLTLITHHLLIAIGVVIVLNWLFRSKSFISPAVSAGASFFIYAVHEPLMGITKDLLISHHLIDNSTLITYFLIPVAVILVCYLVYMGASKMFPRSLGLLVGGRK